jgi:hypothetical protein
VRTRFGIVAALVASASLLVFGVGTSGAKVQTNSGVIRSIQDFTSQLALGPASHPGSDVHFGVGITECPHAGEPSDKNPKPLDRREPDKVEQLSPARTTTGWGGARRDSTPAPTTATTGTTASRRFRPRARRLPIP